MKKDTSENDDWHSCLACVNFDASLHGRGGGAPHTRVSNVSDRGPRVGGRQEARLVALRGPGLAGWCGEAR